MFGQKYFLSLGYELRLEQHALSCFDVLFDLLVEGFFGFEFDFWAEEVDPLDG